MTTLTLNKRAVRRALKSTRPTLLRITLDDAPPRWRGRLLQSIAHQTTVPMSLVRRWDKANEL